MPSGFRWDKKRKNGLSRVDIDRIYQDSPVRGRKPPRPLSDWRETHSMGSICTRGGLVYNVVRDKFDLDKWVFYRRPAPNRSGITVRSSNSYDTKEQAQQACFDFSQPVTKWDASLVPVKNLHFSPKDGAFRR